MNCFDLIMLYEFDFNSYHENFASRGRLQQNDGMFTSRKDNIILKTVFERF